MIARIAVALVVAVVVGLVLVYLIGPILITTGVPVMVIFGQFCAQWGWALAIVAGIWFYFTAGRFWVNRV